MRALSCFAFALLAILPNPLARASEPDNFTARPASLADRSATDTLNETTRSWLRQLLVEANSSDTICDLRALHESVRKRLGGGEIGKLEYWAMRDPEVAKIVVPYHRSIYAGAGLATGSMGLAVMGIVPSIILAGHYVGVDKLGHFFDQGYDYYEAIFIRHEPVRETLARRGIEDESGINGMAGNGIFSYADIAANLSGYLFWREVAEGPNPYYACDGTGWVRTEREFDWAEYVNDAWDEALNCSELKPSVAESVRSVLESRGAACPMGPSEAPDGNSTCARIAALPCAFAFTSPVCENDLGTQLTSDPACERLIAEDEIASQSEKYEPTLSRGKSVRTAVEFLDGAGTLLRMHGAQTKDRILKNIGIGQ